MIIQRSLTTIVALAALSFSLLAQPHIDLRPDRTVFFYAKDAKAAVAAVQNDPVMAKDVEALGIPMQNSTGMDQHETIDKSGFFEVTNFSKDDLKRNEMYLQNAQRQQMQRLCLITDLLENDISPKFVQTLFIRIDLLPHDQRLSGICFISGEHSGRTQRVGLFSLPIAGSSPGVMYGL